MSRVEFKDSERLTPEAADAMTADRDKWMERSIDAEKRYDDMRGRINRFIGAVERVSFNVSADEAEPWMEEWGAFLLSGREPKPVPVAEPVADPIVERSPTEEVADNLPPDAA